MNNNFKKSPRYTDDEIELLIRLRDEGKSYDEIAVMMGRTKHALEVKYERVKASGFVPGQKASLAQFEFKDIFSYLYDCGWRIEDNKFKRVEEIKIDFCN